MRVARGAMKHNFTFGETVPSIAGWICNVTGRPETGFRPKYVLGPSRGEGSRTLVGVK